VPEQLEEEAETAQPVGNVRAEVVDQTLVVKIFLIQFILYKIAPFFKKFF
jgi:hypothetical protein